MDDGDGKLHLNLISVSLCITHSNEIIITLFEMISNYILSYISPNKSVQVLPTVQQDAHVDLCLTVHHLWCLVSSYTSQDRTLLAALSLSVIAAAKRLLVRDTLAHIS